MTNEWSLPPHVDQQRTKLDIPPELLASQRYRWAAEGLHLAGTCAEFDELLHGVKLTQALVDTSQRVQGITIQRRVTLRRELYLLGTPVLLFPFDRNEGDEPGSPS